MEKMKETIGKAAGKLRKAGAALTGDKGLFRQLKEQHAEVSVLMKQVKTGGESTRRQLFPKIRQALLAHARAEQQTYYAAIERYEETRAQAADGLREHTQMDDLVQRLDMLPMAGEEWGRTFDDLVRLVEHHVEEEENEMFPMSKKVLSDAQLQEIERRFTAMHEREMKALQAQ